MSCANRAVFACLRLYFSRSNFLRPNKRNCNSLFGDDAASRFRGAWQVGINYQSGDIVQENGSSYIALQNHTSDLNDASPLGAPLWDLVAASGANGINGQNGVAGEQGPAGRQGEVGPQGEIGPQGQQGPAGATGPQGDTGAVGACEMFFTWLQIRFSNYLYAAVTQH